LIASALPSVIEPTASHPTKINLRVHPTAIHVSYATVIDLVPKLLAPSDGTPTPDFVLHLGLAGRRDWFTLEKGAHRLGYGTKRDVDKEVYPDELGETRWPGSEYPEALETGFDPDDVLERWKAGAKGHPSAKVKDADLRISPDAGDYMCGFIYWNSMSWFYRKFKEEGEQGKDLPVAFSHVPPLPEKEDVEMGIQLTIELIRAMILSNRQKKTGGRKMRGTQPLLREQVQDPN
jgi:pyroglutamyl-peptidase